MSEESVRACPNNPEVDYCKAECHKCGWNPKVARERKIEIIRSQHQDLKLYKVPFSGYCEVLAPSSDEALDKASDEDMFFVHYEFQTPICMEKEENNELDR